MTFEKAIEKLKVLAKGESYTLSYTLSTSSSDEITEVVCSVYVHNCSFHNKPTWEAALDSLAREIAGLPPLLISTKGMPQNEA